MKYTLCLLTLLLGGCISHYSNYQYDNGDDYVSEGTVRIVNDDNGKIGYATPDGIILIEPQYAFGYPFKNGRAKVTYEGESRPVGNSGGEYHYWDSDKWFYIDKQGNKIDDRKIDD